MNKFNPCAGVHTPSQDNRHSTTFAVPGDRSNKRPARTIDEAKLMANVNARAQRLFQDDYKGRRLTASTIRIFSPQGEEYLVDQANAECDCPFFTKHLGKYPCKHILGVEKLLSDQKAAQDHNVREWAGLAGFQASRSMSNRRCAGVVGGGTWK